MKNYAPTDLMKVMKILGMNINLAENVPNLVGIRSLENKVYPDKFNDQLHLFYKSGPDKLSHIIFKNFTTDPGPYYMTKKLLNPKGCAIIKGDTQFINLYKKGFHKGQYPALVQATKIEVYRDRNKNNILDFDPTTLDIGYFGINLHHAKDSVKIDRYSGGCQVLQKDEDLELLLKKLDEMIVNLFDYTVLNESTIMQYVK